MCIYIHTQFIPYMYKLYTNMYIYTGYTGRMRSLVKTFTFWNYAFFFSLMRIGLKKYTSFGLMKPYRTKKRYQFLNLDIMKISNFYYDFIINMHILLNGYQLQFFSYQI